MYFACGDVLPGCPVTFSGPTEDDVLTQVFVHARRDHGVITPPPALEDVVRTGIRHEHPPRFGAGRPSSPLPSAAHDAGLAPSSQQRLRSAFDDAPIGMAVTTPTGEFIDVNPALCALVGRKPADLLTLRLDDLLSEADVAAARNGRDDMVASGTHRHRTETHLVHAQGREMVVGLTCSLVVDGPTSTPTHIVCHFEDITDRVAEQAALAHQALHDALTGLPNRTLIFDRIDHALQRRARGRTRVGVLFCDLDDFKRINDTYGHAAGDHVLAEFARRMRAVQRPGDTTGRLAGDEFIMLCEDYDQLQAASIIARIQGALEEPFIVHGDAVTLTVSIGAAVADGAGTGAAEMIQTADQAMYRAKHHRRAD